MTASISGRRVMDRLGQKLGIIEKGGKVIVIHEK